LITSSVELLKSKDLVEEDDTIIMTAGVVNNDKRHEPVAHTNMMRVVIIK